MRAGKGKYAHLYREYPEIITLDQLYRICRISKRKGKWLLENGIIPCADSGKKTRRFRIKLYDVIRFLERRDASLLRDRIPSGIFSSGHVRKRQVLIDPAAFKKELTRRWADEPDMLCTSDICFLTGYSDTAIRHWVVENKVVAILYGSKYLISKEHLVQYLSESVNQNIHLKPTPLMEIIKECAHDGHEKAGIQIA